MTSKTYSEKPRLMDKTRKRIFLVLTSLVIVISTLGCLKYSNLSLVIILPAFTFLLFQFIALSNIEHKETIFKYTDYVYYALIGGILGVGSMYFLNNDMLELLKQDQSRQVTIALISEVESEIKYLVHTISAENEALSEAKKEFEGYISRMPIHLLKKCGFDSQTVPRQKDPYLLNGCEIYRYLESRVKDLYRRVDQFNDRKSHVTERLNELKIEENNLSKQIDKIKKEINMVSVFQVKVSLIWIPLFLLLGLALKIGKTTSSLCPNN